MTEKFNRKYNELQELKVKLENESNEEYRKFIEEKIKELEYTLSYLEYKWLYE